MKTEKRYRMSDVARIGYLLGKVGNKAKYPTAEVISQSRYYKNDVCRVARMLGLKVSKRQGVWYEQERQIDDILAVEYKKKNRS